MLMLEHDAKHILGTKGIEVPQGLLAGAAWTGGPPFPGPWIVKAQVPAGGRGKAGGVRHAETPDDVARCLAAMIGTEINGHPVRECRIEAAVSGGREVYVSLSVEPVAAAVRILLSPAAASESFRASAGSSRTCRRAWRMSRRSRRWTEWTCSMSAPTISW